MILRFFSPRTSCTESSSTPCLSPTGKDLQQRDQSGPIEVLGYSDQFARTKKLVRDIDKAIRNEIDPVSVHSGFGGAYYFRNCDGENIAIVKPPLKFTHYGTRVYMISTRHT
ncbi:hypothetical protein ACFX2I_043082 [Malus domestica]